MTSAPTATRTQDLPLRRSFRGLGSAAAFVIRADFLVVLVPLNARGFHSVGHAEGTRHAFDASYGAGAIEANICSASVSESWPGLATHEHMSIVSCQTMQVASHS